MLIGDCVARNARQPHLKKRKALIYKDRAYTWEELNEAANSLTHAVQDMGMKKDDKIALLLYNSDAIVLCYYGITKVAPVVPINFMLNKKEIAFIINDSESRILFISNSLLYMIDYLKAECPKIEKIIVYDQDGSGVPSKFINFDDLSQNYSKEEPIPSEPISSRDMAMIQYTGGTTGLPKGVMLSHFSLLHNGLCAWSHNYHNMDVPDEKLRVLVALPFFHTGASVSAWQAAQSGYTIVVQDRFVIKEFLETLVNEECIGFGLVPTMLQMMLNSEELKEKKYRDYLPNVRIIMYGASPIAPSILRQVIKTFSNANLFQVYGCTEFSPIMTMLLAEDHRQAMEGNDYLLLSAGRAIISTDVRIVDLDGKDVKLGEIGEIIGKGEGVMMGYWNLPEKTQATIRDGWLRTGDMGYMDEEGYIYVVDRSKDMIVSGGENIYTKEVEDAIYSHPAVLECAVIGIPDDQWGEAVHAVVVLKKEYKKGKDITEEELIAHVKDQIARYKAPKSIKFKRSLPKSAQGKILKKDLRKKHWEGKERRVA